MELWGGYGLEGRKGSLPGIGGSKYMVIGKEAYLCGIDFTRLTIRNKDFML